MISLSISPENFATIAREILSIPNGADLVAEDVAKTLRRIVVGNTPVLTGKLKRSWSQVQRTAGGFSFSNETPYVEILEEGLYKNVGPRTVAVDGGIYSRQAPGGMLAPVIEEDALISKVANQVVKELAKGLHSA